MREELERRTRERRLRAWDLRGQPETPRREPAVPREAAVLAAHRAGDLVLGGGTR